jgi:hypothetical protein
MASLNPSLLLSLPRRRPDADGLGMGMDVVPLRGEWIDTLFACADGPVLVMVRGADEDCDEDETAAVWLLWCLLGCWFVCCRLGPCWRKAAMKEERK